MEKPTQLPGPNPNHEPWINYHHLLYFKTIAEEGSVSKAAEKLRLGQPTLSAQLKQLEGSLGVMLFERQHKRLVLTDQGRVALDYARQIFKMGSEMLEVLHDRLSTKRIALQIGALDSVAKQVVLELVKKAYSISPCQVTLIEGSSNELMRELMAHRLDLLVTNFLPGAAEGKGLFRKTVSKKQVGIFGHPKFKSLKKDFPRSLTGQPLILPTYDSRLRHDLDHWSRLQNVEMSVIAESQDIAVKTLMAVHGLGLIPEVPHNVSRHVQSGELIEIGTLSGVFEELHLVTANRRIENPIAARLMKDFSLK